MITPTGDRVDSPFFSRPVSKSGHSAPVQDPDDGDPFAPYIEEREAQERQEREVQQEAIPAPAPSPEPAQPARKPKKPRSSGTPGEVRFLGNGRILSESWTKPGEYHSGELNHQTCECKSRERPCKHIRHALHLSEERATQTAQTLPLEVLESRLQAGGLRVEQHRAARKVYLLRKAQEQINRMSDFSEYGVG